MAKQDKIAEIREIMAASGLWIVGNEIWPTDGFHIVTVTSTKGSTDPADALDLADEINKRIGLVAGPLPQKPSTPNVYNFVAYLAPADALTISEAEAALSDLGVLLVGVYAAPLSTEVVDPEDLIDNAHAFSEAFHEALKGDEVPAAIDFDTPAPPNTWVWLGVKSLAGPPIDTGMIKALLENEGYKVIAPDKGISGFFEDRETFITKDGTYVVFNAGNAMDASAANLQARVFSGVGSYFPVLFTTPELVEGQSMMDTFYTFQGVEGGAAGFGDEALNFVQELLEMLQRIMKSLPVVLWVVIGGAVVFLGWNIYKYIREERSRPSVLRRKERRALEERY